MGRQQWREDECAHRVTDDVCASNPEMIEQTDDIQAHLASRGVHVMRLSALAMAAGVKSEERLVVPWDEQDFMALVAQVFPGDIVVDLETVTTQGMLDENLSQLNARLIPHSWQLELVKDLGCVVGVVRRRL